MNTIGQTVKEYWQPLTGIIVVVLAFGKLFWDVEALKTADDKALMQRIEAIERRTDDDALTDWNQWRGVVDNEMTNLRAKTTGHDVDIRDLQRGR